MNEKNENANSLNEEPLITADQVCVEHETNAHEIFFGIQDGAVCVDSKHHRPLGVCASLTKYLMTHWTKFMEPNSCLYICN